MPAATRYGQVIECHAFGKMVVKINGSRALEEGDGRFSGVASWQEGNQDGLLSRRPNSPGNGAGLSKS
jgi:hypothetical protein